MSDRVERHVSALRQQLHTIMNVCDAVRLGTILSFLKPVSEGSRIDMQPSHLTLFDEMIGHRRSR